MSAFLDRFTEVTGRRVPAEERGPLPLMGVGDVELPEEAAPPPAPAPAPVVDEEPTPFLKQFQTVRAAEEQIAGLDDLTKPVEDDPDGLARLLELIPDYGNMPEGEERTAYYNNARAQVQREREERAARRGEHENVARAMNNVPVGPLMQGAVAEGERAIGAFANEQRAALPALKKSLDARDEKTARFLMGNVPLALRPEDSEAIISEKTGRTAIQSGAASKPFPADVSLKGPELEKWRADQERIKAFELEQSLKEAEGVIAKRDEARRDIARFINPYRPDEALADLDRQVDVRAMAILGAARTNATMWKPMDKSGAWTPQEEEQAKVSAYQRAFQDVVVKAINDREAALADQHKTQADLDAKWAEMWGGSALTPPGPKLPIDPLAETEHGYGAAAFQNVAEALRRTMWAASLPFVNAEAMANWVSQQRTGEGLIDEGLRNVGPAVAGINKVLASPFIMAEWLKERVKEKSPYLFDPRLSKEDDLFSPDTREALLEGGTLAAALLAAKGAHGAVSEAMTPMKPIGDTGFMGKPAGTRVTGLGGPKGQVLAVMKDRDMPQPPWDAAREAAQRRAMKEMGPTGAPEARKAEAEAAGRYARALERSGAKTTPVDAPLAELGEKLDAAEKGRSAEGITPEDIAGFDKYLADDYAAEVKRALDVGAVDFEMVKAVRDRKVREAEMEWDRAQREKTHGDLSDAKAAYDRTIKEAQAEFEKANKGTKKEGAELAEAVHRADYELREARKALAKLDTDRSLSSTQEAAKIRRQVEDLQRRRDAALERLPGEVRDAAKALEEARAARERIEGDAIRARDALADDFQRRDAGPSFEEKKDQLARDLYRNVDADFERAIDSGTREQGRWQRMAADNYERQGYDDQRTADFEAAETKALADAQARKERRQARLKKSTANLLTPEGREAEVARARKLVNDRFDAELQQRAEERARQQASLGREFNAVELGQERIWMRLFTRRRADALMAAEDRARSLIHRMVGEHQRFEKEGNALTKAEADAIRRRVRAEAVKRVEAERDMTPGEHQARARGHTRENAPELDKARAGAERIAAEAAEAEAASQRAGTPRKADPDNPTKRATERGAVRSARETPIIGEDVPLTEEEAAAEVGRISRGEPLIVPPGWRPPQDTIALTDSMVDSVRAGAAADRAVAADANAELARKRVGPDLAKAPDIAARPLVALPTEADIAKYGDTSGRPAQPTEGPSVPPRIVPFRRQPTAAPSPILGPDGKPVEPTKVPLKKPAPLAAHAATNERLEAVKAVLPKELVTGFKSVGARMRKTGVVDEKGVRGRVLQQSADGTFRWTLTEIAKNFTEGAKKLKEGVSASFDAAAKEVSIAMLEELAAREKTPEAIEAAAKAANAEAPPKKAPPLEGVTLTPEEIAARDKAWARLPDGEYPGLTADEVKALRVLGWSAEQIRESPSKAKIIANGGREVVIPEAPSTDVKALPEKPEAPPEMPKALIEDIEKRLAGPISFDLKDLEVAEAKGHSLAGVASGSKTPTKVIEESKAERTDPETWKNRINSADRLRHAGDVPHEIREKVLEKYDDPRQRAAVRAAMSDASYRNDDVSLAGAVAANLMSGGGVKPATISEAAKFFDEAAKAFVEESAKTKRLPSSKLLMDAMAQRLLAGENPLDVLRDSLKVEADGAAARAAPKVPPKVDPAPAPVAERKVPAPMRKKVITPETKPAETKSGAFAPDELISPYEGETAKMLDSKGEKYNFHSDWVDPAQIKGSFADERGTKTEGFPESFQARNFNAEKLKEIRTPFDADKVQPNDTTPTVGSPVLWRDPRTGTYYTIAGNHRYLGGQLENYYKPGVPRRFRILDENFGRASKLAALSQEAPSAKMSLAEQARAYAVGYKLGVDHAPGAFPSEPLTAETVNAFLERPENRAFKERLFPEGTPPKKVADTTLFQVESALLGLMPRGVLEVVEHAADDTVKAILAAAPALLTMRSKVARGISRPEFDVLGYFERAARAYKQVEKLKLTSNQLAQKIRDMAETTDLSFEGTDAKDVSPLSHLDPIDAGFLIALAKTNTLENPRGLFVEGLRNLEKLSQENQPGQGGLFTTGGAPVDIPTYSIVESLFGPQIAKQVQRYIDVRARNGEVSRLMKVEDPEKVLFGTGEDTTVASPEANKAVKAIDEMSKPKKGRKKKGESGAALYGGPLGMIFAAVDLGVRKLLATEKPAYEQRMPAAAQAEMGKLEGARRPLPSKLGAVGKSIRAAYEAAREFADIYSEVRHEPGIGNATKNGREINLQVDMKDSAHQLMNADEIATEKAMEIRNAAKNGESLRLASRAVVYRDMLRMVEENEQLPTRKAFAKSEIQRIMAIRRTRLNGELTASEKATLEAAKAVLREEPKSLSGHTPDGIRAILREVDAEIAARPDAQEVVRLVRSALDDAATDMRAMDPNFRGKRDYFPHHVMFDYTLDAPPSTGATGPVKRPFLKAKVHRGGTERPFDVDVAEVIYKHVRDIKRAKVLHDFYEKFRVSPNNLLPELLRTGKLPDGLTPADVSMWSFSRTPTKVGVPVELAHDRATATAALRGALMSGVNPGEVIRQFNRGRLQPYVLVKTNVARALDGATEFAHIPADNIAMIATDMAHALFRWSTLTARGGMEFIERNFGGDMANLMTHVPGRSAEVLRAPVEAGVFKPINFMARSIVEKIRGKEDPVLHRAREMNAYQSGLWGSALEARHRGSIERMVTGKEGPREPMHVLSPAAKLGRGAVSLALSPFSIVANLRVALEASTRAQAVEALLREGYNLNAARVLGNQVVVDYSLLSRNAKVMRRLFAPYLAFVLQTSNNFLFPKVRSRATVWARVGAMTALPMLYNWMVTPDMERELDPKYQAIPHINIGRDSQGRVVSIDLPRFGMEPPASAKVLAGIAGVIASKAFDEDKGGEDIARIARGALSRAGEDVRGTAGPGLTAGAAMMFGTDIRTLDPLEREADRRLPDDELEYRNFVKYGVPIRNVRLAKSLSSFTGIFRPPEKGLTAAPGIKDVIDKTPLGEAYKRFETQNPEASAKAQRTFLGGAVAQPTKTSEPYERGLELREQEAEGVLRAFADTLDRAREKGADKAKLDAEKKKLIEKMKEFRITPETVRSFIRGRGRDLFKSKLSEEERKRLLNLRYAPSAPESRKE